MRRANETDEERVFRTEYPSTTFLIDEGASATMYIKGPSATMYIKGPSATMHIKGASATMYITHKKAEKSIPNPEVKMSRKAVAKLLMK